MFDCMCFEMHAEKAVRFEQLSIKEGLSANYVHTLAQDSLGFVWIGTFYRLFT